MMRIRALADGDDPEWLRLCHVLWPNAPEADLQRQPVFVAETS